jgi:hypothetical protein
VFTNVLQSDVLLEGLYRLDYVLIIGLPCVVLLDSDDGFVTNGFTDDFSWHAEKKILKDSFHEFVDTNCILFFFFFCDPVRVMASFLRFLDLAWW